MLPSLPRPSTVVNLTRSAVGVAVDSAGTVAALPGRALAMLDDAQALLARVAGLVDRADTVLGRAETAVGRVEATVEVARAVADRTQALLAEYEPLLRRGAPMAHRFVEQLSPDEVDAAIRLVDGLPQLAEHVSDDILPILTTLDRVGPDVHELLNVTRDLHLAVAGIPGLRMLRRRGESRTAAAVDAIATRADGPRGGPPTQNRRDG